MNIEIMSGAGNIFSVIDNRNYNKPKSWFIDNISLFTNQPNMNCEGVMIINESKEYEFDVWFLNPDGSTGMMCGNGGRCAVEFAFRNKFIENKSFISFYMADNVYNANILDDLVELYLPAPIFSEFNKKITNKNIRFSGDYINLGSDHYVINYAESYFNNFYFFSDDLVQFASELRFNNEFERGANINYYKKNDDFYDIRTYERGVEAITGACGTGACATALSINNINPMINPVKLLPPSGEMLIVEIIFDKNDVIKNFKLTGPAKKIDSFTIDI